MKTAIKTPRVNALPPLEKGDHLDQATFHARYEAMPEDCRAELIGGIVYMPSPQKVPHSKTQQLVVRWLDEYAEATPRYFPDCGLMPRPFCAKIANAFWQCSSEA